MDFGVKIKNRRKELNLTLKEVSIRVGVAEATVQRWESGNIKMIKGDKLNLLAAALQISVEELTYWIDNQEPTPEDYERWERKFNAEKLSEEAELMKQIQIVYGLSTQQAVELFIQLDAMDQGAAIERMKVMLEDKKYSMQEGSSNGKAM